MDNEKRTRFQKVATKRTSKILNDLRLLGNCGNKSNYSYTPAEVKKIFGAIDAQLRKTKTLFSDGKHTEDFSL